MISQLIYIVPASGIIAINIVSGELAQRGARLEVCIS
jgi:hypothetical protein